MWASDALRPIMHLTLLDLYTDKLANPTAMSVLSYARHYYRLLQGVLIFVVTIQVML